MGEFASERKRKELEAELAELRAASYALHLATVRENETLKTQLPIYPSLVEDVPDWKEHFRGVEKLTDLNRALLASLGRGQLPQVIARQFGIATATVMTHATRMQKLLGCRNNIQLRCFAARWVFYHEMSGQSLPRFQK